MTVADAQERIDSREFAEWMAYFEIDPWGEARIEMAIAKGHAAKYAQSRLEHWLYTPRAAKPKDLGRRVLAAFQTAVTCAEARKKR